MKVIDFHCDTAYVLLKNKDKSLRDSDLKVNVNSLKKGNSIAQFFALFMDAKEEEVNLNSINYMSTVGEERFGATQYINEYFKLKGESSSPYVFASNTINAPTASL